MSVLYVVHDSIHALWSNFELTLKGGKASSPILGPPVVSFYPFLGEGSPAKIDYRKKGTRLLTSLLQNLVYEGALLGAPSPR